MTLSLIQSKALAILLEQYQCYKLIHEKTFNQTKSSKLDLDCINQIMLFPDPVIWILYKHYAYQGSAQAIDTLADLVKHCDHGICQKRWLFISEHIPELSKLAGVTNLEDVADYLRAEALNEQLLIKWKSCEYNGVNGIKKWNNYYAKIAKR